MFRLAEILGCTVSELGERLSYHEFREWIAWFTLKNKH